jgi:hypothetical protein
VTPLLDPRRALEVAGGLLAALLVTGAGQLVMRAAAAHEGEDASRNSTWVRWDSYRYITIARDGYSWVPEDISSSSTGWFPGYPLLVRVTSGALGVRPALAGRAVALAFTLALLALLWVELLPPQPLGRRLLALFVAGFFPGWVYWHAVFPLSMVVFFSLASLALGARRHYLGAGACGALAAFTYPIGVVVALPLAVLVVRDERLSGRERARALLAGPALAVLGLAAVFAAMQATVGRWDAYLRFQAQFGHGLHNPFAVFLSRLRPALDGPVSPDLLVGLQAVLTAALVLLAAVIVLREGSRPIDVALLLLGATLWLLVHAAGPNLSVYRPAGGLVCLVPILARLGPRPLATLLVALLALGYGMGTLFFRGVLV